MNESMNRSEWDKRYQKDGMQAPGTFRHSDAGNIQFYRAKYDALDRCLSSVGASLKEKRVLDAGGGSGQFVPFFLKRGVNSVTITDFSEIALEIVRDKWQTEPKVDVCFMDFAVFQPKLASSLFDFIFVQEAIFLLPDDQALESAIQNFSKYLNSGGFLIISDVFPEERVVANSYVTFRSRSMFENFLCREGFCIEGYISQSVLFNRSLGRWIQKFLENCGFLYYWLDRFVRVIGFDNNSERAVKYLIARKV